MLSTSSSGNNYNKNCQTVLNNYLTVSQQIFFGALISYFGLQFASLTKILQMSNLQVALVMNIHRIFFGLTMFFAGPLCEHFGPKEVSFVSSAASAICYSCLIWVSSMVQMTLLYSILFGELHCCHLNDIKIWH